MRPPGRAALGALRLLSLCALSSQVTAQQRATFALGCFFHARDIFLEVPGVTQVRMGYMGGWIPNPTPAMVATGKTGHFEVVEVHFDGERDKYDDLLDVFWRHHDPYQQNGQGLDIGPQFRAAVFVQGPVQRERARQRRLRALRELGAGRQLHTLRFERTAFWPVDNPPYHCKAPPRHGTDWVPRAPFSKSGARIPAVDSDGITNLVQRAGGPGGTLVLTFTSINFAGLLLNWVAHAMDAGVQQWGVVCVDSLLHQWLRRRGLGCHYRLRGDTWEYETKVGDHSRHMPTVQRLGIVQALLQQGIDVVMSDVDAVFLRNPLPLLERQKPADVVASPGTWPRTLVAAWGATPCMGFILWRAGDQALQLLKRLPEVPFHIVRNLDMAANRTGSDQLRMNAALFEANLVMSKIPQGDQSTFGQTENGLRMCLLHPLRVMRDCTGILNGTFPDTTFVAHCGWQEMSGRDPLRKEQTLFRWGLWRIRTDYRDVAPPPPAAVKRELLRQGRSLLCQRWATPKYGYMWRIRQLSELQRQQMEQVRQGPTSAGMRALRSFEQRSIAG
eukprot:TRINITY_DN71334_c0_g1_i1.p1 TRINITY_DN71334_c0_g1~~TRINITY_DN71334_c0_g1_i1.p1  ORF type:complete len:558 (+),score=122.72 TRINITY_DN71334_c0_g1_i1:85-1758(+)